MRQFLTISKGLDGSYFIILADDAGPIERFDCLNYQDLDDAKIDCERLAVAYNLECLV